MRPVSCILLLVLMLGYGGVEGMAQKTNIDTLLDSDEVCGRSHQWEYNYTVYVDPAIDHKNCDLKTATEVKQKATCPNISTALEHNHRNSTIFVLSSSVTHVLKYDDQSFLQELTDVGFFSESSSNLARVECEDGAGLAFWNVDRIRLQNVEFSFCGVMRNTTSKNFTQDVRMMVRAGLYFYNGTNVTMCHVTVQHGPDSLGVLMYDTNGTVSVHHSNFVNNTVPDNGNNTGGGGFYVEFSYCPPGVEECKQQLTHIANSSYVFYNCTFINNSATTRNVIHLVTHYNDHIGIGEGGGLAIFFANNNATGNTFRILGCLFEGNRAFFGGGMYILFRNTSISNTVIVNGTVFDKNMCTSGSGGALRVYSELHFRSNSLIDRDIKGNSVTVTASYFTENQALQGGAIAFTPTYQISLVKEQTTHLSIANSSFSANHAPLGAAIYAEVNPLFISGKINDVNIKDCIFRKNTIQHELLNKQNHDIGIGVVYTSQVPLNFSSKVVFRDNFGSALALTGTHASFCHTNATFLSNRGDTGGAIAFFESAYAIVNENTNMYFKNNSAQYGGAIYNLITGRGRGAVQSSRACFILNSDPFERKKASFTFENNTSINGERNSIYTTSVYPCVSGSTTVAKNLTKKLLFCNISNWIFINSTCVDEIQTKGNLYELNSTNISSFPGIDFHLPIHVYDDLGHDITSSTGYTATVTPEQQAKVDPRFSLISNNSVSIVGQGNTTVSLELQSTESRPHYLQMEVELHTCPPGLYFEAITSNNGKSLGKCTCNYTLTFGKKLKCSNFKASIPWNFWIGYLNPTRQQNEQLQLAMGEVPNLYSEQESEINYDRVLPKSYDELDKVVCGNKSRTGTLCGKCIANYSTSVNSYDYICTPCDDDTHFVKNILIFIILSYLPYIILLGVVAFFNLKLTSSATNGFILYAQMTSLDIFNLTDSSHLTSIHTSRLRKAYHFIYGILNFNSFASVLDPFCIHKNWTTLDVFLLEYTLAGLPILLILFLYLVLRFKSIKFLCCKSRTLSIRASRSQRWNSGRKKIKERSLIHILVACILLSYTKITVVSMKMLAVQTLFDKNGQYQSNDPRVYFAGHLSFFSKEYFLPYGTIAMLMVLIFVLIPPLFLLGVPQLIDRILDTGKFPRLKRLWPTVTINIFLDAFQGFYKPELYCRIFAGLYFVFRLVIVILYVTTNNYPILYFWQQFCTMLMILLLAICQPYKKRIFNILDMLIFFNLASINMISEYVYTSPFTVSELSVELKTVIYISQYTLLWLPLVYMLSYMGYKILAKLDITQRFCRERQDAISFDTSASVSGQSVQSQSDDEEEDWDSNSKSASLLTDSALFSRAENTNKYRPLAQRNYHPTRTLVDVNSRK